MKIPVKQSIILSVGTIRKYQFAFTLLAFCSFVCAEIHESLHNSAVAVANTTTLYCRDEKINCSDHETSKVDALWLLRKPGTTNDVDISKIFPDRISKNATCTGQYDLTISGVKFEDAGTYNCITDEAHYTAQLIVLDSQPKCNANLDGSDETVLQCTVEYRGNWTPTMKWRIFDGPRIPSNKDTANQRVTSSVERSTISQIVTAAAARYSCEIFFDSDYAPIYDPGRVSATNIPAYHHVWTSPEIKTLSRNEKKKISTNANDYAETGQENHSNTSDNKIAVIAVSCGFGVLVLLVIITITLCKIEPKCRHITAESIDLHGIPTQIDGQHENEEQGDSEVKIIDEVAIFERSDPRRGFDNCQPTMSGPERIYENTLNEAHYMNIENDQPEQPDDELIKRQYLSLETETREASQIPSTYRRLTGQKSKVHQHEPLSADSERPIYINTIAL